MIHSVFVYGTLKQGEVRGGKWPRTPLQISVAFTRGRLFDLGPYPAMIPGDNVVRGERWDFRDDDMSSTLAVLDRIECFGVDEVDLYVRRQVECWTETGETRLAHTYFLADVADALRHAEVQPDERGSCEWRGRYQRQTSPRHSTQG